MQATLDESKEKKEKLPWTITDSQYHHIENIAIFPEAENSWSALHPQHSHNILPLPEKHRLHRAYVSLASRQFAKKSS